ncbi:hypothetical protein EV360DRAFT_69103 [Lentinula raphanica]|nr:hypothetical protein EV360DRAFT_69103 [Lentinula raphanica]
MNTVQDTTPENDKKSLVTTKSQKYTTRISIPTEYLPNYEQLENKFYRQPQKLFYGFGLHKADLIQYYTEWISPELPSLIHAGVRNAFINDLKKHCTFDYFQLVMAPPPDNWHGKVAYTYVLAIYTSHYLHASELMEEHEKGLIDCIRSRLQGCREQEPSWFLDPGPWILLISSEGMVYRLSKKELMLSNFESCLSVCSSTIQHFTQWEVKIMYDKETKPVTVTICDWIGDSDGLCESPQPLQTAPPFIRSVE